jgi:diguanylate cyclase
MAQPFDRDRADALAQREEELRAVLRLMGHSVGDLAGSNRRFAERLVAQSAELEQIADLDPGEEATHRLGDVTATLRDATGDMAQSLEAMAREIERSHQRMAALERQLAEARRKALLDTLTQAHSRAALEEQLVELLGREAEPWSFLLAEIDRFDAVSAELGCTVGDALLWRVARVIEHSVSDCPGEPFVARYGGEEFAVILPGATLDQAGRIAERVRRDVRDARYQLRARNHAVVNPTLSIGVAQRRPDDTVATLSRRANAALQAAKRDGGARVGVADT